MTQSKEPQNEKLINDLYEKLNWYTFEASNEQFDAKEVDAIVQLLDVLEPMKEDPVYPSDPAAARERFYKRYGLEAERAEQNGSAEKTGITAEDGTDRETAEGKPKKRKKKKMFVRFAAGLVACLVLMLSVNVGSYALKKKSFFEVVRDGIGKMRVTVTGNTDGLSSDTTLVEKCDNWEAVETIIGQKILKPTTLQLGYTLNNLMVYNSESKKVIIAEYINKKNYIRLEINVYSKKYSDTTFLVDDEWTLLEDNMDSDGPRYYTKGEITEAIFLHNEEIYIIETDDNLEVLKEFLISMKQ